MTRGVRMKDFASRRLDVLALQSKQCGSERDTRRCPERPKTAPRVGVQMAQRQYQMEGVGSEGGARLQARGVPRKVWISRGPRFLQKVQTWVFL